MRYPGCYLHLRTHGAENNNPKYKKTAQTWVEEGHGEYNGTCRVGWKGWRETASICPACARQPTKKSVRNRWKFTGIDREYTILVAWRAARRRDMSLCSLSNQEQMDKTADEVDDGAPRHWNRYIRCPHWRCLYTQIHCPLLPHRLAISTDIRFPVADHSL